MELIVAILIALGSLTSPERYTEEWKTGNQAEINKAQEIINTGGYRIEESTGGVIVDAVGV